jgi:hypothetical protein
MAPNLRPLSLDDEDAHYADLWVCRFATIVASGYFLLQAARLLGVPAPADELLFASLALIVSVLCSAFVLQLKDRAGGRIRARDTAGSGSRGAALRTRIANHWHTPAVAALATSFAILVLGAGSLVWKTSITLSLIGLGIVVSRVLDAAKDSPGATSAGRLGASIPSAPLVLGAIRLLIYAVLALAIAYGWGFHIPGWLIEAAFGVEDVVASDTALLLTLTVGALLLSAAVTSVLARLPLLLLVPGTAVPLLALWSATRGSPFGTKVWLTLAILVLGGSALRLIARPSPGARDAAISPLHRATVRANEHLGFVHTILSVGEEPLVGRGHELRAAGGDGCEALFDHCHVQRYGRASFAGRHAISSCPHFIVVLLRQRRGSCQRWPSRVLLFRSDLEPMSLVRVRRWKLTRVAIHPGVGRNGVVGPGIQAGSRRRRPNEDVTDSPRPGCGTAPRTGHPWPSAPRGCLSLGRGLRRGRR